MQLRQLIGLICGLVLVLLTLSNRGGALSPLIETGMQNEQDGYTIVIRYNDGFMAATQTGRIDWISGRGEVTKSETISEHKVNSLLVAEKWLIAAGDNGSIWIGTESGAFKKIDTRTDLTINSLVFFRGKIIAAANEGELLFVNVNGAVEKIQLEVKGNIRSISANTTECYGITDQGEIIQTKDGIAWNIFNFNKIYKGFYKPCQFTKVLVTEKQISIVGMQDDGMPAYFYSNRGTVWTQRELVFADERGASLLNEDLNDLFYDESKDQYMLITNRGKLMTVPSCSHCNKLFDMGSTNLKSIAGNENTLIVVGEGKYLKTERMDNF